MEMPPEWELAAIIRMETGFDITPGAVTNLIRKRWREIKALAHAIHDQDDGWPPFKPKGDNKPITVNVTAAMADQDCR